MIIISTFLKAFFSLTELAKVQSLYYFILRFDETQNDGTILVTGAFHEILYAGRWFAYPWYRSGS